MLGLIDKLACADAGKKLEKPIEQTITASGLLLLVGTGLILIVRDTLNLGFLS